MPVCVQMIFLYCHLGHHSPGLFGDPDFSGIVLHIQPFFERICLQNLCGNAYRSECPGIDQSPHRIGCRQPFSARGLHQEITQPHASLHLVREGSDSDFFAETGHSENLHPPVYDDPGKVFLLQITNPCSIFFRLECRAVLKVIDQFFRCQLPVRTDLTIAHTALKCVHRYLRCFKP